MIQAVNEAARIEGESKRLGEPVLNWLVRYLDPSKAEDTTLLDWVFRVTAGQASYSEWGNSKPFLYRIGSLLETIVAKWVT